MRSAEGTKIMTKTFVITATLTLGLGAGPRPAIDDHADSSKVRIQQVCDTELVEELRIGTVTGPEEYSFGQIRDLAVGRDGSIFVADLHPQSVRQFDPAGRFVRQIGREGQGPGEYTSLLGTAILPDGTLSIWDYGNRRISVYDSTGAYLRGLRVSGGAVQRKAFQVDTLGRFYVKVPVQPPRLLPSGRFGDFTYGYARLSPDGTVLDTVSLPLDNPTGAFAGPDNLRPFPTQEVYALSPFGYLVGGSNEQYSFTIRDPNGAVTVENEGHQPVPVTGEERREWEAVREYSERASGISFPAIPRSKPAFRDLWVDADGRIWVHRYVEAFKRDLPPGQETRSGNVRPNITWREPQVFDVYSAQGQFLRCVELPWGVRLSESRGSFIWGVTKGSFDEEYVVRWRIQREEASR